MCLLASAENCATHSVWWRIQIILSALFFQQVKWHLLYRPALLSLIRADLSRHLSQGSISCGSCRFSTVLQAVPLSLLLDPELIGLKILFNFSDAKSRNKIKIQPPSFADGLPGDLYTPAGPTQRQDKKSDNASSSAAVGKWKTILKFFKNMFPIFSTFLFLKQDRGKGDTVETLNKRKLLHVYYCYYYKIWYCISCSGIVVTCNRKCPSPVYTDN